MIAICKNNKSVAAYIGTDYTNKNWKSNIRIICYNLPKDENIIVSHMPLSVNP
jgi:hypothetical protein